MTLADTVLFPDTIMPLYIFEKRYRQMLADSLASDRVFVLANRKDSTASTGDPQDAPCEIATAGLIRVSSLNSDGSSTVALQGAERVRITKILNDEPYMVVNAIAEPSEGVSHSQEENSKNRARLLSLVETLIDMGGHESGEFYKACTELENIEALSYFMLQAYCDDPAFRQSLLETLDTRERTIRTMRFFENEVTGMKLNQELSNKFHANIPPEN